MRQPLTAMALALLGGILLSIVLIVLQVSRLPLLIAGEVVFVVLFSVFYWKPTAVREGWHTLLKKVRMRV